MPSIYYDDSKQFTLKADGFLIGYKTEVDIKLDDIYPKNIDCKGINITINGYKYENGKLNLEVKGDDSTFEFFSEVSLDGEHPQQDYSEGNKHNFIFNLSEKDNYKLIIEPIAKYKIPIGIDFKK